MSPGFSQVQSHLKDWPKNRQTNYNVDISSSDPTPTKLAPRYVSPRIEISRATPAQWCCNPTMSYRINLRRRTLKNKKSLQLRSIKAPKPSAGEHDRVPEDPQS